MKRTESTSSAQGLQNTQPEEFDLVILGGRHGINRRTTLSGREEPRSPPHEVNCNSTEKNRNS